MSNGIDREWRGKKIVVAEEEPLDKVRIPDTSPLAPGLVIPRTPDWAMGPDGKEWDVYAEGLSELRCKDCQWRGVMKGYKLVREIEGIVREAFLAYCPNCASYIWLDLFRKG